jgi:hypothetical protein
MTKKDRRMQEKRDLAEVLSSQFGRRFVKRILDGAHLSNTGFTTDPLVTAHNLGAREIALGLLNEIKEDHFEAWMVMEGEHYRDIDDEKKAPPENDPE